MTDDLSVLYPEQYLRAILRQNRLETLLVRVALGIIVAECMCLVALTQIA